MAATNKVLIAPKAAEAVQTDQYTSPVATVTIIDKFTATNTSAGSLTLSVNLLLSTGTAAASNLIVKTKAISPGKTYLFPEMVNQKLEAGSIISTIASAGAGITISSSGRQVT